MKKRKHTYQTAADIVAGLALVSAFVLPAAGSTDAYAAGNAVNAQVNREVFYGPPSMMMGKNPTYIGTITDAQIDNIKEIEQPQASTKSTKKRQKAAETPRMNSK